MSQTPISIPRPLLSTLYGFGEVDYLLNDPSLQALYLPQRSDPTSSLIDYSGNGRNGTLNGALWKGNSISFDGNDTVTIPTFDEFGGNGGSAITVFVGMKKSDDKGDFIKHTDDANNGWYFSSGYGAPSALARNTPEANVWETIAESSFVRGTTYPDVDTFGTQAFTCADGVPNVDLKVYVNGIDVSGVISSGGQHAETILPDTVTNVIIGTSLIAFGYIIAVYSRVLSPCEIVLLDSFAQGLP